MSFTDKELFISLAVFILAISFSPRKFIPVISVVFLLIFLSIFSPFSVIVFIVTSLFTYWIFNLKRENILIPGIVFLVIIFLLFKIQSIWNIQNPLLAWGYPVGLSYFMVRHIHFLFEAYKENITELKFFDYISYTGFFPAFFTGPIHRLPEFKRDLETGSFNSQNLSAGLERILYGYVKIIVIAQFLISSFYVFHINDIIKFFHLKGYGLKHYFDCIRYGGNLYFQFAGYTDIAIGVSLIAGFKLKENFNFPFVAKNINDFWKRWHISLSDWCKDYVFKPVYANTRIFAVSILMTMLAIGLWHEVSLQYVVWALYHGTGIAIWQYFDKNKLFRFREDQKILKSISVFVSVIITQNFVILSFCITKTKSLGESLEAFQQIFSFLLK